MRDVVAVQTGRETDRCRKVLACVVCGRLKSAFQIASRSGSVADVQYVAHQLEIFKLFLSLCFGRHYMRTHSLCLICASSGWLSTFNLLYYFHCCETIYGKSTMYDYLG
ncbi:hypothetical protein HHK36_021578 [Tetracentron sinense]|uniref:ZFYVE26-like TPR repeats domain-containing protein n=1 Tax=Tetracentron sinense TaxID=13715 RepID=A0A834YX99_TETSI|nr:hypothetical protein HHK36_021578 [Tetracentron sinense]